MLGRMLLLAVVELVADTLIVHLREDDLLEPVVVATDLELICNHILNPVVMSHDFDLANHSLLV